MPPFNKCPLAFSHREKWSIAIINLPNLQQDGHFRTSELQHLLEQVW